MLIQGKILVIRGGAIGDFILTLPVFSALRQMFPGTHVEVLGYPHIARLALLGGLVDGVRSIEARALAGFFAKDGVLDEGLALFLSSFNIIISYLYDPDEIFQANVLRCTRAQFIQGPHRPDENQDMHASEVFLQPLQRLAIFGADPQPKLDVQPEVMPPNCIAIHPGSGSETKNWPEEKWADLLQILVRDSNCHVLIVGGEAEGDKLHRLARAVPPERRELAFHLDLPALAKKLRGCSFFVGHDSGVSHLAAALGQQGLILWGSTKASIWRPQSDRFTVLQADEELRQLPVGTVLETLRRLLSERQ